MNNVSALLDLSAEKGTAILVDTVVPNGHAAAAGVQPGDRLVATSARAQVRACAPATSLARSVCVQPAS